MRVLNVVADGSPGGGTTNVLGLAEDLVSVGVASSAVGVITQADSYLLKASQDKGLWSHGIDFFKSRFDPRVGKQLKAAIERFSPDILHLHGARAALQLCLSMPRQRDYKVVYTVHGYHFYQKNALARMLAIFAERKISAAVDATVFVCNYDRGVALQRGIISAKARQEVIYNGFVPSRTAVAARPLPKMIAVLGRLTFQKDPLLTIEIAKLLAPHGYRFLLIGGGDMEAEVQAKISQYGLDESVKITGALAHQEALAALGTARIMMLPSRWEGFPIAPIEAMYNRIPVVGADVSGIPEIVLHEKNGLLVHERSPAAYAAAIQRLNDDETLYRRLATEARDFVESMFTRDKNLKAYLSLYHSLTGMDVAAKPASPIASVAAC